MENEYFEVDLSEEEKQVILKFGYVTDQVTLKDLHDGRKKWVKFTHFVLELVIGDLCYHFNRCDDNDLFYVLDRLINHLEDYQKR